VGVVACRHPFVWSRVSSQQVRVLSVRKDQGTGGKALSPDNALMRELAVYPFKPRSFMLLVLMESVALV
jgi:hypothetical protein